MLSVPAPSHLCNNQSSQRLTHRLAVAQVIHIKAHRQQTGHYHAAMRSVRTLFGLLVCVLLVAETFSVTSVAAARRVRAVIDLSDQRMYFYVDGAIRGRWPVSTARRGYRTTVGSFLPIRLERTWYSRKYDWAPMPYSVFFLGGYAIHGTTETRRLGRPVSHGCVRLHRKHASTLFRLIRQVGRRNTRIIVRR